MGGGTEVNFELGGGTAFAASPDAAAGDKTGFGPAVSVGIEVRNYYPFRRQDRPTISERSYFIGFNTTLGGALPTNGIDSYTPARNLNVGVGVDATGNSHSIGGTSPSGDPFNGAGETHTSYANLNARGTFTVGGDFLLGSRRNIPFFILGGPSFGAIMLDGILPRDNGTGVYDLGGVAPTWGGEISAGVSLPVGRLSLNVYGARTFSDLYTVSSSVKNKGQADFDPTPLTFSTIMSEFAVPLDFRKRQDSRTPEAPPPTTPQPHPMVLFNEAFARSGLELRDRGIDLIDYIEPQGFIIVKTNGDTLDFDDTLNGTIEDPKANMPAVVEGLLTYIKGCVKTTSE